MKLPQQSLAADLKRKLSDFYFLSGDDPLLMDEAITLIRQEASIHGFTERNFFQIDKSFEVNRLKLSLQHASLFSEKKIVECRVMTETLPDSVKEYLVAYSEAKVPDRILLLSMQKLDGAAQNTRWFKALEAASVFVQLWPPSLKQLPQWIMDRLRVAGLRAEPAAMQLLQENGEGNLFALKQEIEKLSLLHPGKTLTVADVEAAITNNARYSVFELADSVLMGECQRVVRILQGLKAEKIEPILVLWALTRDYRTLANLAWLKAKGMALEKALLQNGVWPQRKPLVMKALNVHDVDHWQQLLERALKIDYYLKTSQIVNVWTALSELALAGIEKRFLSQLG